MSGGGGGGGLRTYRSTCAARQKLQVLLFLCGGKRRYRRGVRRRPKSRGRRGAYAPPGSRMGVGTHPCARKRPLGGLRDQNRPGLGGWDKRAVRAIRLRCAPDCFMFMRTQVCYKTYRSTCAARQKLQVLLFLCGGKRRYRPGVRRRPKSRGRRGAYAPRPAPLPRIAPAPEKKKY